MRNQSEVQNGSVPAVADPAASATWVRVRREVYEVLGNLRIVGRDRIADDLRRDIRTAFEELDSPAGQAAIEKAKSWYKDVPSTNTEIQIDDNAPLSRADDGCWVGAWVWVPNGETGEETDQGFADATATAEA